jgi:hypothetical protein
MPVPIVNHPDGMLVLTTQCPVTADGVQLLLADVPENETGVTLTVTDPAVVTWLK